MEKPWEHEPDEKTFMYRDYFCYIIRHPSNKSLCGYVGIEKDQLGYKKDLEHHIDVHGGITFMGHIGKYPEYWFAGFDCAHSGDLCPGLHFALDMINKKTSEQTGQHLLFQSTFMLRETYRTIEYVTNEIQNMVDQIYEKKWEFLFE